MTTIQNVIREVEIIKTLATKKAKQYYVNNLHRDTRQFLGANINMVGIGPEIFQEITIGRTNVDLKGLIDAFDTASKIGSSTEKRTIIRGITLTQEEKDFVGRALYSIGGSLNLGITIPRISDGITDVIAAMLASNKPFDLNTSIIEQKFDGYRCIARKVDEETVILHSRNGKPMKVERVTSGLMDTLPVGTVTDGEIVAANGAFQSLKIHGNDVTYQMFDCLYMDGQNIMNRPLTYRREKLESLDINNAIYISEILDFNDMTSLDAWVEKTGAEGIIAKDPHGKYRSGKRDWIKYKQMHDLNCQIVGMTAGSGKRRGMLGALVVEPEGLAPVQTKVGTGFSDIQLGDITDRINRGEQLSCVVRYQDITRDKRLRFPVFVRLI